MNVLASTYVAALKDGDLADWSLPHDGGPGEWMNDKSRRLIPIGYLIQWLAPNIYLAVTQGKARACMQHAWVNKVRLTARVDGWNAQTQRLIACACAEHVAPIWDREFPKNRWPEHIIETARDFVADGDETDNHKLERLRPAGLMMLEELAAEAGEAYPPALLAARAATSAAHPDPYLSVVGAAWFARTAAYCEGLKFDAEDGAHHAECEFQTLALLGSVKGLREQTSPREIRDDG